MRKSFATRRSACHLAASRLSARLAGVLALCILSTVPHDAVAQVVPGEGSQIGSLAAERARLDQLRGRAPDSVATAARTSPVQPIFPTVRVVRNTELPFGGNDGALWAGRGLNASISGGFAYTSLVRGRRLELRFEPEVVSSDNRPIPVIAGREPGRSAFSSPWHTGLTSADLPLRFGDQPVRAIGPGQSSITVTTDRVAFGAASTSEWWGPALRNTLLLSNNAAGVPRLFARTSRPLRTRFGNFEGRAFIGGLTESPYFDLDPSNDVRSLSGLLVTYRPAIDTGLTLGLSRLVMAKVQSPMGVVPHLLDALVRYEALRPATDTSITGQFVQSTDQLFSLFARWVFPESGVETYAEWTRLELPLSLREYLEAPQNTQGYTLGLQWANPRGGARYLRLQGEVSYLEQTPVIAGRPTQDYYTGRATAQGFTQRGQILGAGIGPGSSSQFIGGDWIAPRWQAGAFVGRVRTENDALYREGGPRNTQHDVTLYSGVRAGVRLARSDISCSLTVGRRYNYLFQSNFYIGDPVVAADVQNTSVALTFSPR